jgi:hypothetical protein
MLTLVTVIYGDKQTYRQELYGSVLSILKARLRSDTRIVVYTDRELHDFPLPIIQRIITSEEWSAWTGPHGLTHLMKLHIIRLTLQEAAHPVIYFDTDTIFLVAPEDLSARLSPGTALMHADEGPISGHEIWATLAAWLGEGRTVNGVRLSSASIMYNSGIVGVVPEHLSALGKAAPMAETLESIDPVFSLDQFSTANALNETAKLLTCEADVLHYWGWRREFIQHAIGEFWARHRGADLEEVCARFDPKELNRLPRIHWLDRVRARIMGATYRLEGNARFSYLAIVSALRHASRGETVLANLWFAVHMKFLGFCGQSLRQTGGFYRKLLRDQEKCLAWLSETNLMSLRQSRASTQVENSIVDSVGSP